MTFLNLYIDIREPDDPKLRIMLNCNNRFHIDNISTEFGLKINDTHAVCGNDEVTITGKTISRVERIKLFWVRH